LSTAFSFLFSFYGLILGMAVAEIAAGFSRAYDQRREHRIGLVAPLFGALLLCDLLTFWANAYTYRELEKFSYLTVLAVAVVSLLYYFAATQVFPKATEKETLDDHIMEHRKVVVFCVLVSNLMTQVPPAISAYTTPWPTSDIILWCCLNLAYYALLLAAALVPSKRVVVAIVTVTILYITGATALFS